MGIGSEKEGERERVEKGEGREGKQETERKRTTREGGPSEKRGKSVKRIDRQTDRQNVHETSKYKSMLK